MLGIGIAVGYVVGARAGRKQYDAMKATAARFWENPRVTKARREVVDYAKEQAPVIRERAEHLAKAAPGVVADTARNVADTVGATAKNVADAVGSTAKNVAERVGDVATDVRERVGETASGVREHAIKVTAEAREHATKLAADLRDRGEHLVDDAVRTIGETRDELLDDTADEDEPTRPEGT